MDKEEIIEKLLAGEMKLYQIDKFTENATEALDIRREFIDPIASLKKWLIILWIWNLHLQRTLRIL